MQPLDGFRREKLTSLAFEPLQMFLEEFAAIAHGHGHTTSGKQESVSQVPLRSPGTERNSVLVVPPGQKPEPGRRSPAKQPQPRDHSSKEMEAWLKISIGS